jgi:hypothetical protein
MKSRFLLGSILAFVLSAGSASAQESRNAPRKVEIFFQPVLFYVRAGGSNTEGSCTDVAVTITDAAALVGEVCGTHQYVAQTQVDSLLSHRGGMRFSKRPGNRITTFIQALAGGESGYRHAGRANNSGFSIEAGGGVDLGLKNWLGLRIAEANYQMTRVDGATVNGFRFGAGLVFRIGKR